MGFCLHAALSRPTRRLELAPLLNLGVSNLLRFSWTHQRHLLTPGASHDDDDDDDDDGDGDGDMQATCARPPVWTRTTSSRPSR